MKPQGVVWPLAAAAALVILGALFMDRYGAIDEIGLFNPSYMFAYTGRMTYPAHYYPDSMVVHPPTHYAEIGWLLKAGIPWYYAEALPTVLWHLFAIIVIARAPFTAATRIGLLAGLCAPILLLHNGIVGLELFGMRPEGELNAVWIAGLVMMESARRRNWHAGWFTAGVAVLTFACTVHYYAAPAWLAVLGYLLWAWIRCPDQDRRRVTVAVAAGTLVVAAPLAVLFLIPQWDGIIAMIRATSGGSLLDPVRQHFIQYEYWRNSWMGSPALAPSVWLTGTWPFLALRIPLVAAALGLLLIRRETRALAAAASPLLIALVFLAQHKHAYYFVHELSVLTAGVWSVLAAGLAWSWSKVAPAHQTRAVQTIPVFCLAVALVVVGPRSSDIEVTTDRRIHEGELARAAGLEMLGPSAVVGGRIGAWYVAGARHWLGLEQSSIWAGRDPAEVVARFDALAETWHMSDTTLGDEGPPMSAMYADGTVTLRGFFVASRANPSMSYVLLGATRPASLVGYASTPAGTVKVTEDPAGSHFVDVAVCQARDVAAVRQLVLFAQELLLPNDGKEARYVMTAVRDERPLPTGCRIVSEWRATVSPIDTAALIARARQRDTVIRFYRQPGDLPPR